MADLTNLDVMVTKCEDGSHCTEASSLRWPPGRVPSQFKLGDHTFNISDRDFVEGMDTEVRSWTYVSPTAGKLTVFND